MRLGRPLAVALLFIAIVPTALLYLLVDREKHPVGYHVEHGAVGLAGRCAEYCGKERERGGGGSGLDDSRLDRLEGSVLNNLRSLEEVRAQLAKDNGMPPAAPAAPGQASPALPLLAIGIPTVARPNVDYLTRTLSALASQMPPSSSSSSVYSDPMAGQYKVLVMNNDPNPQAHAALQKARRDYEGASWIEFLENDGALRDETPELRDQGSPNVPGWRVRKQTRDVAALALAALGKSRYFLFMEDDFEACPHTLRILHYLIGKAHSVVDDFISIRVSYGMNGFLVRNGPDLEAFARYLLKRQRARPPDHVATEWSAGETPESNAWKRGRAHMAYRFNLFSHLGTTSSLREQPQGEFAGCYQPMGEFVVFEVEAFKFNECGHDDIWPCQPLGSEPARRNPPFSLDLKRPSSSGK